MEEEEEEEEEEETKQIKRWRCGHSFQLKSCGPDGIAL